MKSRDLVGLVLRQAQVRPKSAQVGPKSGPSEPNSGPSQPKSGARLGWTWVDLGLTRADLGLLGEGGEWGVEPSLLFPSSTGPLGPPGWEDELTYPTS